MNKSEKIIVAVLCVALLLYVRMTSQKQQERVEEHLATQTNDTQVVEGDLPTSSNTLVSTTVTNTTVPGTGAPAVIQPPPLMTNTPAATTEQQLTANTTPLKEEVTITLTNDVMAIDLSSHGGGITRAELFEHRKTIEKESGNLILDFSDLPALTFNDIPGLGTNADFTITKGADANTTVITAQAGPIVFTRTLTLGDDHLISIKDEFRNNSAVPITLPRHLLKTGRMKLITRKGMVQGYSLIGIDSLFAQGGSRVRHWGKLGKEGSIDGYFYTAENAISTGGCMRSPKLKAMLDREVHIQAHNNTPTDWVAVKNIFFTQIIIPKTATAGFEMFARRDKPDTEDTNDKQTWVLRPEIESVWAGMVYQAQTLQPNAVIINELDYYVGPKQHSRLNPMGNHLGELMEFAPFRILDTGWFRGLCGGMVKALTFFYGLIPNWGVAIILLTISIRLVFMPILNYGTKNMKAMQELQPEMKALNEKYKDDPMKRQQAIGELYRNNKVNPLKGCLPMVIQIPFFFALYSILRTSVLLRFAEFAWVHDLSEMEGLFEGMLPFGYSLNILPILMIITMIWQQKLTPSTANPEQQKMMMIMLPAMMFIFCYNLPAGLMLYWTTSQLLAIIQMKVQNRKKDDKKNSPPTPLPGKKGKKATA